MAILTDGVIVRQGQTLEEFDTPLSDYLGAKFQEGMDSNPVSMIMDHAEFNDKNGVAAPVDINPLATFGAPAQQVKPRLPAADVEQRAKEAGVKIDVPEGGLSSEALDVLIERKKRQRVLADTINRSPTGVRSVAGVGASLAAGLLDPLNIGLAFVPVVGEARYATMLAKAATPLGRAGVRAGVGAAEGALGIAAFEPFNYQMHRTLQDDYSAMDSLMNIAFGSILGGGLHVAGGAFKDAYLGQWWKPEIPPAPPPEMAGTVFGGQTQIKIGDNYHPARWALVDAGDVEATMSKADNQFRDRTRVASDEQIRDIANKIDFNLLGDSPVMDLGAPTLANDGRIVGGNGRMAAIGRAYDIGTGARYSSALERELVKYGIDPDALAQMKKPALVRVLDNDVDIKRAAMLSNEGGALRMSALEQAKVDAERLGDFRAFDVNEGGELNTAGNRSFIRSWVNQQPVNQRSALMDADGLLSLEGQNRLRNAILFKAYGDSPTLGRLVEATDPGSRNVASALTRSAARVADAQESIRSGDLHAVDIADDVRSAVEKLDQLRKADSSVAEFLAQGDLLGSGLSPEAIKIMRFMEENIRSPRAMSDMINRFYDGLEMAGNPKQGDMLGGGAPSKSALLDNAIAGADGQPTASAIVDAATPQQREAALRTAVGQAVEGRSVDIEPLFMPDADTASSVARQRSVESVRVADVKASEAADERLAAAPKSEALADAEADLARVMKDLEERAGVPLQKSDQDVKPMPSARPPMADSFSAGPFVGKTTPIDAVLYRETNSEGLDAIVRGSYTNSYDNGAPLKVFVADNADIAIGQGTNKGIFIQFRKGQVSGKEHFKPGTGAMAGREYLTDFIGLDAIDSIKIDAGQKISNLTKRLLKNSFDPEKMPDGSVVYTRKGLEAETATPAAKTTPEQQDAALRDYVEGGENDITFIDFTQDLKMERPETLALMDKIASMPATPFKNLYRVLGFESKDAADEFVASLSSGVFKQDRPVASFTTHNPIGKSGMENIGKDLASQFGDNFVTLHVKGFDEGRDISFMYRGGGYEDLLDSYGMSKKDALDVIVPNGSEFKVVSIKDKSGETVVTLEAVKKPAPSRGAVVEGQQWFHGTSAVEFDRFGGDMAYLTTDRTQAGQYASGAHLGGGKGGKPRVLNIDVAPGDLKNIDDDLMEAMADGDDLDDAIKALAVEARADGYRYMEYMHPNAGDQGDHLVRISLFPQEDIKIVHPSAEPKAPQNPIALELQPYDDAIKSSEALGRAARAAAVCDLRG